jgi:hypothetical protein
VQARAVDAARLDVRRVERDLLPRSMTGRAFYTDKRRRPVRC